MHVEPTGLVAAAEHLLAAAAQFDAAAVAEHPPLAPDHTSVAAAARLNAAASALLVSGRAQARALRATAGHLIAIAARFDDQESLNASTISELTTAEPVGAPGPLDPVPALPADVRAPLSPPAMLDGESVARLMCAGSAGAGTDFVRGWRARAVAATTALGVVHDVSQALPDAWSSPSGTAAATTRLGQHARELAGVAARSRALAEQADRHAAAFGTAVAQMPKPSEFDDVRARLAAAVEANTVFPGQYAPLVSSLIAKQGQLQHRALSTQGQYHAETAAGTSPEEAAKLAAQLPSMLPGMLGAIGGMIGGAVSAAAQIPQALMQTGQQLATAATQGLSGLAASAAGGTGSAPTGFGRPAVPHAGGAPGGATTSAAGIADAAPLSASSPSSAPPAPLPQGASPAATAPGAGATMMPMGMPMGVTAPPTSGSATKSVPADKKIVVPVVAHTESVTGRVSVDRLVTADGAP